MSVVEATASVLSVALDTVVVVVGIASAVVAPDTAVAGIVVVVGSAVVVGIVVAVGIASKRLHSLPS